MNPKHHTLTMFTCQVYTANDPPGGGHQAGGEAGAEVSKHGY
jgi:hypothetical protein